MRTAQRVKTVGQHEHPPFVEVKVTELFAHTSKKIHTPTEQTAGSKLGESKHGPLFQRDVFPNLENQNMDFM